MPTWFEHCDFVLSRPYAHWYIAESRRRSHAAPSISRISARSAIGILSQRGHGYAFDAVAELMRLHPGRFLWNVAPLNTPSIALARKLGFGAVPIQYTYAKEME
jgi:RimJ/RimL family protein N-acetyltransferase